MWQAHGADLPSLGVDVCAASVPDFIRWSETVDITADADDFHPARSLIEAQVPDGRLCLPLLAWALVARMVVLSATCALFASVASRARLLLLGWRLVAGPTFGVPLRRRRAERFVHGTHAWRAFGAARERDVCRLVVHAGRSRYVDGTPAGARRPLHVTVRHRAAGRMRTRRRP
jgi:hypothetical protein